MDAHTKEALSRLHEQGHDDYDDHDEHHHNHNHHNHSYHDHSHDDRSHDGYSHDDHSHHDHSHHDHNHQHHHDHDDHHHDHHHDHYQDDDYSTELDIFPEPFLERFEGERFDGIVMDVRETWEVEQISIRGSLHIPLQKLQHNASRLDPDQAYYVLCTSGIRSSYASAYLYAIGFENVYNIKGGLNGIFEQVGGRPSQPEWLMIPGDALPEKRK